VHGVHPAWTALDLVYTSAGLPYSSTSAWPSPVSKLAQCALSMTPDHLAMTCVTRAVSVSQSQLRKQVSVGEISTAPGFVGMRAMPAPTPARAPMNLSCSGCSGGWAMLCCAEP